MYMPSFLMILHCQINCVISSHNYEWHWISDTLCIFRHSKCVFLDTTSSEHQEYIKPLKCSVNCIFWYKCQKCKHLCDSRQLVSWHALSISRHFSVERWRACLSYSKFKLYIAQCNFWFPYKNEFREGCASYKTFLQKEFIWIPLSNALQFYSCLIFWLVFQCKKTWWLKSVYSHCRYFLHQVFFLFHLNFIVVYFTLEIYTYCFFCVLLLNESNNNKLGGMLNFNGTPFNGTQMFLFSAIIR